MASFFSAFAADFLVFPILHKLSGVPGEGESRGERKERNGNSKNISAKYNNVCDLWIVGCVFLLEDVYFFCVTGSWGNWGNWFDARCGGEEEEEGSGDGASLSLLSWRV